MLKHFLYTLIVFITSSYSWAADTIILNDSTEDFVLESHYYEILEDPKRKLTIQDVSSDKFSSKFKVSEEDYNYVENPESAYWLRFTVKDISKEKNKWVIELLSLHTQNIQFYIPNGKGEFDVKKAGQNFPFLQREYDVTNLVFDIPYNLTEKTFYVRIESKHTVGFEFKIRSQNYFTHYTVKEYYFLGFYYGILFIMAIYNFLLFFSSKEKVYIYYMLYVVSCMLVSFTEDGLGFQFVWPDFPEWNWHINNYLWSVFFLITFISYSTAFLELKKNSRKFYIGVVSLSGLYLTSISVELVFPGIWDTSHIYVLPFITVYVAAVYVYKKGFTPGRFFILGYTFVFISIIILQLRNYNFIEHNIFTVYSFNYGIVLQVVVLSFALGDRIKIMKAEKDMAQRILIRQLEENQTLQKKVNRELEEKVNSRTQQLVQKSNELSEANVKLQKMTEELNKFASKLDQDNWELNKKVIEETKARMISKELSYEEFTKIFPNDFSCLKYIEEIKWATGYECRKCGNIKFTVKPKLLSRKCSKCNYIESVTSSTIFHAIKFPVHKAFYIAYITSIKNDKISVDDLAELLQLNRLTCWKFRKKVIAKESEVQKKLKISKIDNWEILIKE